MTHADATVALTGTGAVSPLGDAAVTWWRLLDGDSALETAPEGLRRAGCEVAGAAEWVDAADLMDRNVARRMGRFSRFSVPAAGFGGQNVALLLRAAP